MKTRKLMTLLIVLALIVPFIASCRPAPIETEAPEREAVEEPADEATEEPADEATEEPVDEATEEPEPIPEPEALDYDVEIYGELENLDPREQIVTFWYQHSGSREELMLSLIDDFNRSNEWGITVQGEYQGSYDELYQKIVAGIPAKQLPSMAVAYQNQAATYAGQGVLLALDPYIESAKWGYSKEELDDFFPIALAADYLPQFEARYGWPPYKSMEVMYYNEDWLSELGYTDSPKTWDEFAEMACAAAEQPFSGATGEGQSYGYVYSIDASRFATFVFSRGGNIINENGTGYIFNSPEGYEALTFLKDLVERGCASQQTERYGDQSDFGAGRSLFTVSSISGLPYYKSAVDDGAGFSWSVNPLPHTTPEPRMNIYGASISIFESTPEEQLASWLFLKWLSEPEQQKTWASSTGYFPTRASAAELLSNYFAEHPTYEKAFGFMSMDYGIESPVAGYDECRASIEEMLTAVLGSADAQAQLDVTVEHCNEYLEEAAP
ncbi:MAG TPA: ABC transporter substrate-binding protein [Chloroflexi bacterium]|nr:ABC transporter substrate-binding protein [Chloroflexota bacterium]